jgi:hypothetical protein
MYRRRYFHWVALAFLAIAILRLLVGNGVLRHYG